MRVSDINELYKSGVKRKFISSDGKEFEIEIHKLGTDEIPLLFEMQNLPLDEKGVIIPSEKFGDIMKKLVAITLRRSLEDATDETNLEFPLEYAMDLFEGIMEANKKCFEMKLPDEKLEFLKKIKEKQSGHLKQIRN